MPTVLPSYSVTTPSARYSQEYLYPTQMAFTETVSFVYCGDCVYAEGWGSINNGYIEGIAEEAEA
jgi:hypothetical protein